MSKRERVEDLGRLLELLVQLSKEDIFDHFGTPKWATDWFFKLSIEDQQATIHSLAYKLSYTAEKLSDCIEIASGQDYLNEKDL